MQLNGIKKATLSLFGILALSTGIAQANDYPNKPVKVIVPFAPGGTTDIVARLMADKMSQVMGQPFIVENRAGAGGAIGTKAIADAPADGYTIGMSTVSSLAVNPACNPKLFYDPMKDFTYVTNIAGVPNVMTINPTKLPSNFKDALKTIQEKPGKFTYASSGACGIGHMMGELFEESAKAFMVHIPYRGAGPALTDLLGGQVDAMFDNLPSSIPHLQSGKIKALAVAAPRRLDILPDVPTFIELGHPAVNEQATYGFIGPANMPADIVKKLHEAVIKVVALADVKEKLKGQGASAIANSPTEFKKQTEAELNKMKHIVKTKNIKFDN
ncbi:Bug family tripartite tricarboxylate transporter substrate binding protein [Parvibium lacunae]|uniref:Tripartite tricarboxylate transporter substrate binding protein BugE n=1 Tax=Parvibium lacunae TaxID=1888893 RepID=A0A368KYK1_9BURK|nr:tripartite tricarboxylate transporter substrate binding protein BugE [Parvibium lacunae]RCS56510.1 tripartite tricarboxylate transporter substrate binding protein BugE [Parvibium lacunae]